MPEPSPESMFDHVYAEPHELLVDASAASCVEYEASFVEGTHA